MPQTPPDTARQYRIFAQTLRALTDDARGADPAAALARHATFLDYAFHTLLYDALGANGAVDDSGVTIALRAQKNCRYAIAILTDMRRSHTPIPGEHHDDRTD